MIQARVSLTLTTVHFRLTAAFGTGGATLGNQFRALGRYAEGVARTVLRTDPRVLLQRNAEIGGRVIDFVAKVGNQRALIEVKYALPAKAEAITRLANQVQAALNSGQGQVVVWTLRDPRGSAQVSNVVTALGGNASRVQFVHGVSGLNQWMSLYFR